MSSYLFDSAAMLPELKPVYVELSLEEFYRATALGPDPAATARKDTPEAPAPAAPKPDARPASLRAYLAGPRFNQR